MEAKQTMVGIVGAIICSYCQLHGDGTRERIDGSATVVFLCVVSAVSVLLSRRV